MKTTKIKEDNPLGVLLNLLENKSLDISNFSLSQIADDYLKYLSNLRSQKGILKNISEFLWVASRLALIKSRSLISFIDYLKEDFEEDEIGNDLKERLIEYKKFQEISKEIAVYFKVNRKLFSKKKQVKIDKKITINFNKEDLKKVFKKIVSDFKIENQFVYQERLVKETIKIEERIEQLKNLIKKTKQLQFSELISKKSSKVERIVSFLSVLELVKQGSIIIKQRGCFQEINIIRK